MSYTPLPSVPWSEAQGLGPSIPVVAMPDAAPFLWYGWSGPEADFRWTDSSQAALVFAWPETQIPAKFNSKMGAFTAPETGRRQRVIPVLNGAELPAIEVTSGDAVVYEIPLPLVHLRRENILQFKLPDAAAPVDLGLGPDERLLGLRVEWFEIG